MRSRANQPSVLLAIAAFACLHLTLPVPLMGQQGGGARSAGPSIRLTVRPALGDRFSLVLEQVIEVSPLRRDRWAGPPPGAVASGAAESTRAPDLGPRRATAVGRVTSMLLYGHSSVESSDDSGAILLATLDSLRVRDRGAGAAVSQSVPIDPSVRVSRVQVAPNGAMRLLETPGAGTAVGRTLSAMPAMLPDGSVKVGETWAHAVDMPALPFTTYRTDGVLQATFRLDSLTRDGRDAWVSVKGTLHRDGSTADLPVGTRVITDGFLEGTLRVDRERGWIVDARTTVSLRSDVVATGDGTPPMHIGIRISQRIRQR
jgi:hypothetical protein